MADLMQWVPREAPKRVPIEGRLVRLEPLDPARHSKDLYDASTVLDAAEKFKYLFDDPPTSLCDYEKWVYAASSSASVDHFAVILKVSGRAVGRQAFMRTDRAHGSTEIGSIYWGPEIAGTTAATEALFLFASHVFDDLGYRRFEWKCDALNAPSRKAALRFGFTFEGVFRQHMVVKGKSRDTAWFAMIDEEWPPIRNAFQLWLQPTNFDDAGIQIRKLEEFRCVDTNRVPNTII